MRIKLWTWINHHNISRTKDVCASAVIRKLRRVLCNDALNKWRHLLGNCIRSVVDAGNKWNGHRENLDAHRADATHGLAMTQHNLSHRGRNRRDVNAEAL